MRFWISLIIVVGLALCIRALKMKRPMIIALLVAYSISVLIITLGSRRADIVTHIGYDPFIVYERTVRSITQGWKTGGLQEAMKHLGWQIGQLTSLGLNVLLFVPFGYLLPSVTARMNRWWKVLLLGFGFSLLIETVQLITKLGWFDASDLLHNSIGALIGYGIYHRWLREKTT